MRHRRDNGQHEQNLIGASARFAALYEAHFARVYNYMRFRVHDAPTADDLTARTFERAWVAFARYQPERAPFGAWLFAIARNTVRDHLRAARLHLPLSLEDAAEHANDQPDPETQVARQQTFDTLLDALAHLDERERDLLALKFAAGLTNIQIAELMHMSAGNVAVILYRALRQLRAELSADIMTDLITEGSTPDVYTTR